ncbi:MULTISPECIES: SDR family NAD(P)-dependent oxidoreductase [Roseobacteraceae]|jgi:NAD(P)-dependent dehydrogenase (short-subunit alcohol dehydrogenase family)|uniref:Pyridoxal 4-dehydrogenase n=1 Tax=Pseudosulfitobacter pseudonitzschiae TaxID=1402135 RepID=A0A221K6E6_9RHOB|nr:MULTISPECIES: SDR family oxidoreductase [Roseobacteraceae]ASM74568.1 pyridoxal 4-dehydrogenase [Pseudosulfitobacter pseudonitzschiae]
MKRETAMVASTIQGILAGRRVLYTGAAGGLGHQTTLEMLAAGAEVFAIDRDHSKNERLMADTPPELADRLRLVEMDLTDGPALEAKLAEITQNAPLDVVINNAAIYPSKPFEDYSMEELRLVHQVNVEAALICTKAALAGMRDQGWGRIINVTSITLTGGWENLAPYVQSKGSLLGLTRAWAREFGKWGITCNAIAPGAFPTDAERIHPDPEGYKKFVLDHQAVKRRGTPHDIAATVLFLTSDGAGFITGQNIAVDGGWNMS